MVKIIQISVASNERKVRDVVYGLGDDGKVYRWRWGKGEDWTLDEGKAW
jgi:hypothetical protein